MVAVRADPGDPLVSALLGRCTFPPAGTATTCAVSGGADSSALLALAVAAGLEVTVAHVDHGLRPDSDREAEVVRDLAVSLGAASFVAHRVAVPPGPDLENRARRARRAVLGSAVLWGHTADDQAETVVLRLLRGTGPAGLAAMRPDTHPLLRLRRADTVALCDHLGIAPLQDPTNADPRFTRNRVRHEVLPLLHHVAGRDVVPLLCRLADQAAEQRDVLEALAATVEATDAAAVRAAGPVLGAEALRSWWHDATGGLPPPDRAATWRMLAVAAGDARSCDVVAGWRLRRRAGRLELVPPGCGAPPAPE
jgi:tRNA(Ile)-lysidine synthase